MIYVDKINTGLSTASTALGASKTHETTSFEDTLNLNQQNTQVSLENLFQKAAKKYNVDINLLKAIAKQESNFQLDAVSHCGATGIMQLMPATAKAMGVKDSKDPEQNIMGGAKLISQLLDKYDGNIKLALAGYNAGIGNVAKYGGVPPFEETKNYIKKVMNYYKEGVDVPDKTVTSKDNYSIASDLKDNANLSSNISTIHDGSSPVHSKPEHLATEQDFDFSYQDYLTFIDIYLKYFTDSFNY